MFYFSGGSSESFYKGRGEKKKSRHKCLYSVQVHSFSSILTKLFWHPPSSETLQMYSGFCMLMDAVYVGNCFTINYESRLEQEDKGIEYQITV